MKKLTIKYWNTVERSSKERALSMVYGNQHGIINMLLNEKPNKHLNKDTISSSHTDCNYQGFGDFCIELEKNLISE